MTFFILNINDEHFFTADDCHLKTLFNIMKKQPHICILKLFDFFIQYKCNINIIIIIISSSSSSSSH